jgi:hypothetical protein
MDYAKFDLNDAISHCKSVISEMSDCDCKEEYKQLLFFLQELQFRQELDKELPWEIQEIIKKFKIEYFNIKENQERSDNYDYSPFNDIFYKNNKILNIQNYLSVLKYLSAIIGMILLVILLFLMITQTIV